MICLRIEFLQFGVVVVLHLVDFVFIALMHGYFEPVVLDLGRR